MSTLDLHIEGMSCQHCIRAVQETLSALPGVTVSHVEIGSASVELDPAQVAPHIVTDALADAGYVAAVSG